MSIELRHFRSFVAVSEEGNIGRAARRLFITQPALSRQMQLLEREIGAPLLLRTARGVDLTDAGRQLLAKARVALDAADDALMVGRGPEPRGRLVLGLPLAGTRDRWFGLAQAFAERYPAVELELREAISEHLQHQLTASEIDVALALAPTRLPSLRYTHVYDEPLSVWMHRSHRLADRSQLALTDLLADRVVLVGGSAGHASGFNSAIRALFADLPAQPEFVETTEVFPARAVRDSGDLGISVPVDFLDDVVGVALVPERTLPYEVVHRDDADRSAVRAFGPFAADHLAAAPAHHARGA